MTAVGERRRKRLGFEAERKHHIGDATRSETIDQVHDHRPVEDRQHRLGNVVGERPQASSEPADEHDGEHQPPAVVGASEVSVTAVTAVVSGVEFDDGSPVVVPATVVAAPCSKSSGRIWSVSAAPSCGRFWATAASAGRHPWG